LNSFIIKLTHEALESHLKKIFRLLKPLNQIVIGQAMSLRAKKIAKLLSPRNWAIFETTSSTVIYPYKVGKMFHILVDIV